MANKLSFEQQVDRAIDHIKDRVNDHKKSVAASIFTRIVRTSPAWSGAYVDSHHIGVGRRNNRISKIQPGMENKKSPIEIGMIKTTVNLRELSRLKTVKFNHKIKISNSIRHAKNIEYLGFMNMGPRFVYKHAVQNYLMNPGAKFAMTKNFTKGGSAYDLSG